MYEQFKKLLDTKGVTVYRVSKETGISPTVFSEWKSGRSAPKIDKLQKIAEYFGVNTDYFLGLSFENYDQISDIKVICSDLSSKGVPNELNPNFFVFGTVFGVTVKHPHH